MKINRDAIQALLQTQLQGYDFVMLQNIYLLPGNLLDRYIRDYAMDNPAIQVSKSPLAFSEDLINIEEKKSLYTHLAEQIDIGFLEEEKFKAKEIAGNLDENGFSIDIKDCHILEKMHYLDPVGIATKSPKDAMLIQLKDQGKESSLAHKILGESYENFLLNNKKEIAEKFCVDITSIADAFNEIIQLTPFPGRNFSNSAIKSVYPEMKLTYDDTWELSFEKDYYPTVALVKGGSKREVCDAKKFIFQLNNRKSRLELIVSKIVKAHSSYLLGKEPKGSLLRKSVLSELDISESTFSRILSGKYIETPIGVFPLSYFFTKEIKSSSNSISTDYAKKVLQQIIENEDSKNPYSDRILKDLLEKKGIACTRRRIAKYRRSLLIPGVYQRTSK